MKDLVKELFINMICCLIDISLKLIMIFGVLVLIIGFAVNFINRLIETSGSDFSVLFGDISTVILIFIMINISITIGIYISMCSKFSKQQKEIEYIKDKLRRL